MYLVKWVQRKLIEMGYADDSISSSSSDGAVPVGADPVADTEF